MVFHGLNPNTLIANYKIMNLLDKYQVGNTKPHQPFPIAEVKSHQLLKANVTCL